GGPFMGELELLQLERSQIVRASWNRRLHTQGSFPPGAFGFAADARLLALSATPGGDGPCHRARSSRRSFRRPLQGRCPRRTVRHPGRRAPPARPALGFSYRRRNNERGRARAEGRAGANEATRTPQVLSAKARDSVVPRVAGPARPRGSAGRDETPPPR